MSEDKTPWNPSRRALARVKDPLPAPTECRFCQGEVCITPHSAIYHGRSYGDWPWVYNCDDCGARVGMHPFTNIPLGTLANEALRKSRDTCKKPFEELWRSGGMGRNDAYRWLAGELGKSIAQCHFGLFEADDCERARQLCQARLDGAPTAMSQAFSSARGKRA